MDNSIELVKMNERTKALDDFVDDFEKWSIGQHFEPCVKCGNILDMNSDYFMKTTNGTVCKSCVPATA